MEKTIYELYLLLETLNWKKKLLKIADDIIVSVKSHTGRSRRLWLSLDPSAPWNAWSHSHTVASDGTNMLAKYGCLVIAVFILSITVSFPNIYIYT